MLMTYIDVQNGSLLGPCFNISIVTSMYWNHDLFVTFNICLASYKLETVYNQYDIWPGILTQADPLAPH